MIPRNLASVLVLLAIAAGSETGCPREVGSPSPGWVRVAIGPRVSLTLPRDLHAQPGGGKDSLAKTYRRPGLRLVVDTGWYPDPLNDRPGIDVTRSEFDVDGHPATWVAYRDPDPREALPWVRGVHVPSLDGGRLALTVLAQAANPNEASDAERILRSVRIARAPSAP